MLARSISLSFSSEVHPIMIMVASYKNMTRKAQCWGYIMSKNIEKWRKNWYNNPHFKHIIYNMPTLTILQSSYTIYIFWSFGYIWYIKLPSPLPQKVSGLRERFYRALSEARGKMKVTWTLSWLTTELSRVTNMVKDIAHLSLY